MKIPWLSPRRQAPTFPRGAERFRATGLTCPLGEVLDLSVTGLRARRAGKPLWEKGELVTLTVSSETQSVRVHGRVVWSKRVSLRGVYELGVQFIDVRPGVQAALMQLGRYGFISADGAHLPKEAKEDRATGSQASGAKAAPVRAAVEVEDLYAVLGVTERATAEDIKHAYRSLAMRHHPDVSKEADAAERFALITKSYTVLKDVDTRKRYDEMLRRARAA